MRLIDADALIEYINPGHLRPPTEVCFSELGVCEMIEQAPTIDAVPKTQCRDCQFSGRYSGIDLRKINATD